MNTHKTLSLLAAVLIVAAQAALFAVDTHATTANAAYATTQNASTIRGA